MTFNHILVDVDSLAPWHPALDQAVYLARRAGARLTIADVVEAVPDRVRAYLSERLEGDIMDLRRQRLKEAIAPHAGKGVEIDTVVLRGRPALALIHEVLNGGHDLLVRYHARDLIEKRPGFGAVDMQLMRKCPCPVWLVGVQEDAPPLRILAAIDPDRDNPTQQQLNQRIVEAAALMARLEKGSLVLMTAWAPYGVGLLGSRMNDTEVAKFVRAARKVAKGELEDFVGSLGDIGVPFETALVKGSPQDAIPKYCKRKDIDLVVMGTVARTGVVGMIMGNTAERVLQQLKCSVLALKPAGFDTPVKSGAESGG
jgi:nucleotide-binding universal stress UspA family protein